MCFLKSKYDLQLVSVKKIVNYFTINSKTIY